MAESIDLNHAKQRLIGSNKADEKVIGLHVSIETDNLGKC